MHSMLNRNVNVKNMKKLVQISNHKTAIQFLQLCGFQYTKNDNILTMKYKSKQAQAIAMAAYTCIKNNPIDMKYFGNESDYKTLLNGCYLLESNIHKHFPMFDNQLWRNKIIFVESFNSPSFHKFFKLAIYRIKV